jgi:two-component system, cell cycle sensor histidine kinase and response regulator CckA
VYGIVKQNAGYIDVCSEVGMGSCFQIYLPRHVGKNASPRGRAAGEASPPSRGDETILLAEDEPALRTLAARMLARRGYRVLTAGTPAEAVRLAGEHRGEIHLLLTDVVMPGMNGRELGKALLAQRPQIKCLYMSGYTADVLAPHGVLEDDVRFIQKPFTMGQLAARVRDVLDHEPALES